MIPGPDEKDILQRGQLPVFIPNYYRGAYSLFPQKAGRSSQLFNTGTVHWVYRCLIDGLTGLKGTKEGLQIDPHLPGEWKEVSLTRHFKGATFYIGISRVPDILRMIIELDGVKLERPLIREIVHGKTYHVKVMIPLNHDNNS
jgi:cellobionic acid phosphorylase